MSNEAVLPHIDWMLAARTAGRMAPAVELLDAAELKAMVLDLRATAERALPMVSEAAELPSTTATTDLVIDRLSFTHAVCRTGERLLASLQPSSPSLRERVQGRALALQMAPMLAFLSTRVLGQFDPFAEEPRLCLVAPNIALVERSLKVSPADFRLWVCLHEQTHRLQFDSAPWLAQHLSARLVDVMSIEATAGDGMLAAMRRVITRDSDTPVGFSELVIAPEARADFNELSAVMALLEGHAEAMMDRAGRRIGSLAVLRRSFDARRRAGGRHRLLRQLFGLEAKMAQYRTGRDFCEAVIRDVGIAGLNVVFTAPEKLPTAVEINEPQLWLQRVHG